LPNSLVEIGCSFILQPKKLKLMGNLLTPQQRRDESRNVRQQAAQIAHSRALENHVANDDETNVPLHLMNFTKGLPHDPVTGLIEDEAHFDLFVQGICSGDPDDIE